MSSPSVLPYKYSLSVAVVSQITENSTRFDSRNTSDN